MEHMVDAPPRGLSPRIPPTRPPPLPRPPSLSPLLAASPPAEPVKTSSRIVDGCRLSAQMGQKNEAHIMDEANGLVGLGHHRFHGRQMGSISEVNGVVFERRERRRTCSATRWSGSCGPSFDGTGYRPENCKNYIERVQGDGLLPGTKSNLQPRKMTHFARQRNRAKQSRSLACVVALGAGRHVRAIQAVLLLFERSTLSLSVYLSFVCLM